MIYVWGFATNTFFGLLRKLLHSRNITRQKKLISLITGHWVKYVKFLAAFGRKMLYSAGVVNPLYDFASGSIVAYHLGMENRRTRAMIQSVIKVKESLATMTKEMASTRYLMLFQH